MSTHNEQAQSLLAAALRDRLSLRLLRESGEAPQDDHCKGKDAGKRRFMVE